jgi:hypothetical protein
MAARVADRLCQAHEPVMVCASILNVRVCAAAPISDVKAAPLSTALTVKVTWRSSLGVGVWLFGFGRQRNLDQSANCLGPAWLISLGFSPFVDCGNLLWQQPYHHGLGAQKRSPATAFFPNIGY